VAGGLAVTLPTPATAVSVPTADQAVLTASANSKVTYGLQALTAAPTARKVQFASVTVASRGSATGAARAAVAAARTPQVATVATKAVKAETNPAPNSSVLGIASGLSGIYYRWGGTTPAGFDCSGFVQYVYRQVGVSLPRTAGAQRAATQYVSNPQPGDLVFFGTYHVGIYAGNGMMYDSPTSGQTTGLHKIWGSVTYGRVG